MTMMSVNWATNQAAPAEQNVRRSEWTPEITELIKSSRAGPLMTFTFCAQSQRSRQLLFDLHRD